MGGTTVTEVNTKEDLEKAIEMDAFLKAQKEVSIEDLRVRASHEVENRPSGRLLFMSDEAIEERRRELIREKGTVKELEQYDKWGKQMEYLEGKRENLAKKYNK